jgi:predicted helicase
MGGKAQRIRDNLLQFLAVDSEKNNEIKKIYKTLQKLLVHDLKADTFADMYAQTLVYGLFVARYHDKSPENFSRREARELVPNSNPFLRHFFDHIVGPDFDKRLEYIVDELCEVFSHANVPDLMKQYFRDDLWGKTNEGPDPVIHFYEDFLREYDADLRKKLGAYYTPQPVVKFIVRAVDYLLQKEFGLPNGLADTTKTQNGIHKVQILDPAVGTGTFLSAVIRSIYLRLKDSGQLGRWTTYVHHDLLPRIHGFEIMMAPYTIAHLKLSMAFKATGFKHFNRRLGIYLTNSLEEADEIGDLFTGFGFAESIAEESKEAAQIKNDTPIMVVIGNPPYSVSSSNKGEWITNLIKDYKKDLNERNIQPLSDDYIKFVRYAEHFVMKNKTGIVAMITNNSFLDGIIHRQMRKHLLETFDEIYILDLHGNAKKKETAPDGSKDENVFDIQQGVAISIMIKNSNSVVDAKFASTTAPNIRPLRAIVKFAELYGKREVKFDKLNTNEIDSIQWKQLKVVEPNYFFVEKDFANLEEYSKWKALNEIFPQNNVGIATGNDAKLVSFEKTHLEKEYLQDAQKYSYRPFDSRYTIYDKFLLQRARYETMKHLLQTNLSLQATSKNRQLSTNYFLVSNTISDRHLLDSAADSMSAFPLYLYTEAGEKVSNLNQEIVNEIEKTTGKTEPEEILDYIYAVLHSPSYRKKYKEFLKIDFPRVPYPKDKTTFKKLVKLGTELRGIHLLESPVVNKFITTFPNDGSYEVEKIKYVVDTNLASPNISIKHKIGDENIHPSKNKINKVVDAKFASTTGDVYFNEKQYFGNVPETAWNFYIGGYQPAQKWLKDRKGRTLTNEEIEHYQKIIVALTETDRLMKEVDNIDLV